MPDSESYFIRNYSAVQYPVKINADDDKGLRKSQIGAIHAISSHFTLSERAAVVVLPTGAGKTAVLMLAPYVLRVQRALVITQSVFVRDQIADDFKNLATLKRAEALPQDLDLPTLLKVEGTMDSNEAWETLREYDVVVATPHRVSPGYDRIIDPPSDLFDLVLIDEAHHSPAPTWNAIIEAFPQARVILFTATPFRRDKKEIKGRDVYAYSIQRAFEDEVYGEMNYMGIEDESSQDSDITLALEVAKVFDQDKADGFEHALMARAESRSRADTLAKIYNEHTSLRLQVVHSGHTQYFVKSVIKKLRKNELDGVICVNMLGEGFDLPRLKIAALHSPHRSLAVTLQFLGRFARKNGQGLGTAKFLAMRSEIDEKLQELFNENEAWGRSIRALGQARISEEIENRAFAESFEEAEVDDAFEASLEGLSLLSFSVFNHVKIFQVHGNVDLHKEPVVKGFNLKKVMVSDEWNTTVFIVQEAIRPDWVSVDGLERIENHLFVIYYDEQARLLFICSTYREESAYTDVALSFLDGYAEPLSLSRINRILRSYAGLTLYNVGMRNRALGTVAESYRQVSGGFANTSINKGDGALYHRGHIFGKGETTDGKTTIGLSSLSKVWRLERTSVKGFIAWCKRLARDIENAAPFSTGMELDHLDAGKDITLYPDQVTLGADWSDKIYTNPPSVFLRLPDGSEREVSMLDLGLVIDRTHSSTSAITVRVCFDDLETIMHASLEPYPSITYVDGAQPRWEVKRGFKRVDLAVFLTNTPLRFHFADGSLVERRQLFEAPVEDDLFDAESFVEGIEWDVEKVDIQKEYGVCTAPLRSVQDWLEERLVNSNATAVFFDHRTGECADFLTISEDGDSNLLVELYHCKKSGGARAGDRVDDLYDVCGQATKCVQFRNKKRLIEHIKERLATGSVFKKSDTTSVLALLAAHPKHEFALKVYVVQPGVTKAGLTSKMKNLLSTTSRGLIAVGCNHLHVISSH